ncbi:hypothetical protein I6F30_35115 [Bradyrhizobium sp. NBAIM20]|uniref:hypothetical protein n=1 Tax=Bradyrhizobium sp. NBAIM20 TaxID=2793811 RepID=UPI001CD6FDE9|nr:hypothetical protein [Bradyrhizobium sp. NBAIM20]MCA1416322.1 hypothetical protein [Bradyrhizobium sp. NBAIM20]
MPVTISSNGLSGMGADQTQHRAFELAGERFVAQIAQQQLQHVASSDERSVHRSPERDGEGAVDEQHPLPIDLEGGHPKPRLRLPSRPPELQQTLGRIAPAMFRCHQRINSNVNSIAVLAVHCVTADRRHA